MAVGVSIMSVIKFICTFMLRLSGWCVYLYKTHIHRGVKMEPNQPAAKEKQKRRTLTLSDAYFNKAMEIGEGNVSEGIRRALKAYRPVRSEEVI